MHIFFSVYCTLVTMNIIYGAQIFSFSMYTKSSSSNKKSCQSINYTATAIRSKHILSLTRTLVSRHPIRLRPSTKRNFTPITQLPQPPNHSDFNQTDARSVRAGRKNHIYPLISELSSVTGGRVQLLCIYPYIYTGAHLGLGRRTLNIGKSRGAGARNRIIPLYQPTGERAREGGKKREREKRNAKVTVYNFTINRPLKFNWLAGWLRRGGSLGRGKTNACTPELRERKREREREEREKRRLNGRAAAVGRPTLSRGTNSTPGGEIRKRDRERDRKKEKKERSERERQREVRSLDTLRIEFTLICREEASACVCASPRV